MANPGLHVVWFKRDLRIDDHWPLLTACQSGPVMPVFFWAPEVWQAADASAAQAAFVQECLLSLAAQLQALGLELHVYHQSPVRVLQRLQARFGIAALYSHEETGNAATYQLDLTLQAWCRQQAIPWREWPQNGVVRRLQQRQRWQAHWEQRMQLPVAPAITTASAIRLAHHGWTTLPSVAGVDKPGRQLGGQDAAQQVLHDFLQRRARRYRGGISSPRSAEQACSRLSPYLAWGVLSLRAVVQQTRQAQANTEEEAIKRSLHAFESRLHWHCHFMQKLESEPGLEFNSYYRGFDQLHASVDSQRLQAWQQGETGWPLVDACMRMLHSTGWLNFRMRAMLMSTASYLLWLPWRQTGLHLAREFVDYEPGIHWPQVQMQSGTTGINTLRIYHPVKQAMDLDASGEFVRRWIPSLRQVPDSWIFEPWNMPRDLQHRYGCVLDQHYPAPLVEVTEAMRLAKHRLYAVRQQMQADGGVARVLNKHASRPSAHFPTVARGTARVHNTGLEDIQQMSLPW